VASILACPGIERALERMARIHHAPSHGRGAGAVLLHEGCGTGARLGIQEEVDVALAVKGDVPGPVPRRRREAHLPEQQVELFRLRVRELDELEAVGAGRVAAADRRPGRIMREGSHGVLLLEVSFSLPQVACEVCARRASYVLML